MKEALKNCKKEREAEIKQRRLEREEEIERKQDKEVIEK